MTQNDTTNNSVAASLDILLRGAEAVYSKDELASRLLSGKPMRVKLGLDPTSPDIHLGHTVVLRKLRQFQDLGHKAVMIIGDYTARIGDPTGVNRTRPMLTPEQIKKNAETYFQQAGRILNTSPDKLEVRYNSEWLAKLSFADVIRLASQMTVAQMMERDTFEKRYKAGQPIGVHEFFYPLMQGYDSVMIEADVELGGTDQTFNNLVGRDLQINAGQQPQIVMVMPILVGLDGVEKMSKSKGNYIGVTDEPNDMFGKIMSIPDSLMENYFTLLTNLPMDEIKTLCDPDKTHPRQAKARLGRMIVENFYSLPAAQAASDEFDRVFAQKNVPTDMPEISIKTPINIIELVTQAGFAQSNGEARRLIQQGAVSINDEKISELDSKVLPSTGDVLKVGKRRFARLVVN
ncbi:MAG TPA: tyrosine--tRNA ligase [Phycisphaerae bacterium]|nr:tyrosine--tRNA ligase [Phycisphaerae bacterium]HPS52657.1 tyrosine--tRNA ligase [Phycisphaerae bacterium]